MCMAHLLINTFIHLNLIVSFKLINMPTPLTVSEPLNEYLSLAKSTTASDHKVCRPLVRPCTFYSEANKKK